MNQDLQMKSSNGLSIPQRDTGGSSILTRNGEEIILDYTINQESISSMGNTQQGMSLNREDSDGVNHSSFYTKISKGRYSTNLGQDHSGNSIWELYMGDKIYIFKTSKSGDLLDAVYYHYYDDDVNDLVLAPDGYCYYLSNEFARAENKLVLKKIDYYLF